MSERRKALGYMRVSTPGQATNGLGLQRQRHTIQATAEKLGLEVIATYEDVGSAGGPFSDVRRGDLQDVLKLARAQDMPIIVSELSRLTREPSKVDGLILLDGVEIISGKFEEMLSPEVVRQAIERAHRSRLNISKGTAAGHARRKARGEISGHVETLEIARENSLATRTARAGEVVDLVAAVLEQHPGAMAMPAAGVARLLNDRGILSGWRRPWTPTSVRRVLRAAKAQIQERREVSGDETMLPVAVPAPSGSMDRQPTMEEVLAELAALTLGGENEAVTGSPASSATVEVREDEDLDLTEDDDLRDLDLAIEREQVYAEQVLEAAKAVKTSRARRPSTTRASPTPAAKTTSDVVKEKTSITSVPGGSTPPAPPPATEETDDSYKDHPGYGIF